MNEAASTPRTHRRRRTAEAARVAGQVRRNRRGLLSTTALQATALILLSFQAVRPAAAQPAPTARPTGGAVVAGSATIAQTTAQTTVAQSSARAAVDWTSYNIGSQHTVQYQQPGATSITLNRVTGPDPSQIAGKIQANGQVVIVNGNGVVFYQGSQVDVQSLVVSSAGVTNANFMAGKMVFDQAGRPDARISNAGTISVAATGLAALVAPQVANSGVINARMGHVVLAGAEAHTVDLYGDGLMSVDVTREVRTTQSGATALVTNTGTIVADGGTIMLTAKAADGIIQNLVSAKGRLQANSVGSQNGTVVVSAIGGSISIEGAIHTDGHAPGTSGGTVQLAATDTVAVGAGARIAANGRAGGGTIAIGTTPARTLAQGTAAGAGVPASSARVVTVASGARISADGKGKSNGGAVALLSTQGTAMAGAITARGGAQGGDGGRVEISSATSIGISGTVNTTAPKGQRGTLLLDPATLLISDATTDNPAAPGTITGAAPGTLDNSGVAGAQTISSLTFNTLALANNMVLTATDSITLAGATALTGAFNISLTTTAAASSITVGVPLTASGSLTLAAGGAGSTLSINAAVGGSGVSLSGATVAVAASTAINGGAAKTVAINADTLTFGTGATVAASGGTVSVAPFTNNTSLTIEAVKGTTAGLSLTPGDIAVLAPSGTPPATLNLGSTAATPAAGNATANAIGLNISLTVNAGTLGLYSSGGINQTTGTALTVSTLTGGVGGTTDLSASGTNPNVITTLGAFTNTAGSFLLDDSGSTTGLNITGTLNAFGNTATLTAASLSEGAAGNIVATTLLGTVSGTTNLNNSANAVINLGAFSNTGGAFTLNDSSSATGLNISGGLVATGQTVSLTASALTEGAAGTITAATLTGSVTGATELNNAGNAITNLGTFSNPFGAFTLDDSGSAAGLKITGGLNAAGQTVTLTASSLTRGAAGTITADTLTGTVTGVTDLDNTGNNITHLSTFSSTGAFTLVDTGAPTLSVDNPLSGSTVALTGNSISIGSSVTSTAATPSVSINADTLTFPVGASIAAANGTVAVAPLTANKALTIEAVKGTTAGLSLTPADVLILTPVVGPPALLVLGSTNATPSTSNATANAIGLKTSFTVNATTLGLYSSGTITQTTGTAVTVNTLTGAAAGTTDLSAGGTNPNKINNLGGFSSTGGDFSLDDSGIAGALNISGVLDATAHTVSLVASGLTEGAAGSINSNLLTGTVTGTTLLDNSANQIGNLGPFSNTGGDFTLDDRGNLGALRIAGAVSAGTHTVKLTAVDLTESGTGTIAAGTLTGSASGTVTLDNAGNAITNLGLFNSTGFFTLNDTGSATGLNVSGALTATGQTVTLTAGSLAEGAAGTIAAGTLAGTVTGVTNLNNAGNNIANLGAFSNTGGNFTLDDSGHAAGLNISGALNAVGHTVSLTAPGLSEGAAGTITAATLTGTVTGTANLNNAGNTVTNLGAFSNTGGAFTLDDSGSATGLNIASGLTATGQTVALTASSLSEGAAGTITAGTLTGTVTGITNLNNAGNAISNLGNFSSTGGNFSLNDSGVTGLLNIAGFLNAAGHTVSLITTGLTEGASGKIAANVLTGSTTGDAVLDNTANAVSQVNGFTSLGNFTLDNLGAPLTVGTLTATGQTIALQANSLTFSNTANVSASRVELRVNALAASGTGLNVPTSAVVAIAPSTAAAMTVGGTTGTLNLSTGTIANLLKTSFAGTLQLGSVAVTPTAANALATTLSINDSVGSGSQTVGLYATTSVGESASGSIGSSTLQGASGGAFDLSQGSNIISNLGPVTAGSGAVLALNNITGFTVGGTLSAPAGAISLTVGGNLTISAGITTGAGTGSVSLVTNAPGDITQTAAITTGTLSGSVNDGSATLTAANQVTTLGSFSAPTGNFSLTNSQNLGVSAGSTVTAHNATLSVTGTLTVNGDIGACAVNSTTAGVVDLQSTGVLTIAAGIVGGERSTVLEGHSNSVTGGFVEAGRTDTMGNTVYSGTITIDNGLSLSGTGTVSANTVSVASGDLNQSGGTLAAGTLSLAAGSTYVFTGGNFYTNGAASFTTSGIAAGSILSGGSFTITGSGTSSSTFTSAGDIYSSGSITFKLPGNFSQTQGTIAAMGDVTVNGLVTSTIPGVINQSAGATLASGGTLSLNALGTAAASLLGTLAGTTVYAYEQLAPFNFGPAVLKGPATVTATGYTASYHCPGCDAGTPSIGAGMHSLVLSGSPPTTLDVFGSALSLTTAIGATNIYLNGGSSITQTAAAVIMAGTLTGASNGNVDLTTASNKIGILGAFPTATGLALDDRGVAVLTVNGAVSATTGTVALRAASLKIDGASGGSLAAPRIELLADAFSDTGSNLITTTGTVAIAPSTDGLAMTIGTAGSGLVISAANLLSLLPTGNIALLQLGTTSTTPATLPAPTAGTLTFNQALNLQNRTTTLGLYSKGSIAQTAAGGILLTPTTGTLTGTAGTNFTLDSFSAGAGAFYNLTYVDAFPLLGPISGTSVSIASSVGSTTTGAITAGAGSVALTTSGTLAVNSIVGGGANTGNVVLQAKTGISESAAGGIQTATLTGTVGNSAGNALLTSANNLVATLGNFAVLNGSFSLIDGQTLNVPNTAAVTGTNVTLTTTGATSDLTIDGTVGATAHAILTASGTATIDATGVVGGGTLAAITSQGGANTVSVAGLVDAQDVKIGNGSASNLVLATGKVFGNTAEIAGTVTMTGGLLHAQTLSPTGTITFSAGDLYAGNNLAITVPGATLAGTVATQGALTVTTGTVTSTANLISGGDTIFNTTGDFTESAGTIAAHGNLTVTASGLINQNAGSALDSTGTILLSASATSGTASILGAIAASTLQVVEPGAALTFNPASFTGSSAINVSALSNTFSTTPATASSTYSTTNTPSLFRAAGLRLDGATLSLSVAGSNTVLAADTVELHSFGSTTQLGGSLQTGSLSGTAGYAGSGATLPVYDVTNPSQTATVTLASGTNNIAAITGYQVRGDDVGRAGLTLVDAPAAQVNSAGVTVGGAVLTLTGTVQAGLGTTPLNPAAQASNGDNITITMAGTLAVNGTLAGNVVTLNGGGAVTETGMIVAGTLTTGTGSVLSAALNGANQIGTLGVFAATAGDIGLTTTGDLTVSGEVSATLGAITVTDTGNLTVNAPPSPATATITAQNVTLNGTNIIVSGGLIGACENGMDVSTGNTALTATGAITVTSGQVGGQTSITLIAPGGVTVGGTSGAQGYVDGPTVTVGSMTTNTNLLVNQFGNVFGTTVTVYGDTTVAGGTLNAQTFTTTGTTTTSGGSIFSNSPLTITTGPTLSGLISTGGLLTINGADPAGITSTATVYAGGDIAINATAGDFHQTSGTIATVGNLTVTASGLVIQDTGAALDSGMTLLLRASGAGSASISGMLAGATVQVIEPAATLSMQPSTLANAAMVTVGMLTNTFHCPGCDSNTPSTSVGAGSVAALAGRPAALRLDGSVLSLGTLAADTVELHSLGATSQQPGATLITPLLTGTAGYAGTSATLPVYTPAAAQTRTAAGSAGYTHAPTVMGATVTLGNAGNNVAVLGDYQVRGDDPTRAGFMLADAPTAGLLLNGTLRAGPSTDPLDASAAAATGNNVSITLTGANQTLTIGDGHLVGGNAVTLIATGALTEAGTTSRIVAATLTGSAGTSVTLATATDGSAGGGGNQIATLGSLTAGAGTLQVRDSRSLSVTGPVTASSDVTIIAQSGAGTASVIEGASAGNLTLAGTVSSTGGNATLEGYGTLSGSSVSGATVTLLAGADVNVTGVSATTLTGSAGGSFAASGGFGTANSVAAVGGALTLTDTAAGTLSLTGNTRAANDITVNAPSLSSTATVFTPAAIHLHVNAVSAGNFTQSAGTIGAGTNLTLAGATDSAALSGTISQTGGTMAAGNALLLFGTGNTTQAATGTIAGATVEVISTAGSNNFAASQAASVSTGAASVNLAGVLPVFTIPNPAGTVTLTSRPLYERLDGSTVSIPRLLAADTVELHAAGNLSETPGGVIRAVTLTGTAGYAASGTDGVTGLPTYLALNGALPGAGSATLTAATNNILRLGDFQARSGLTLADAPANQTSSTGVTVTATGLTIAGTVRSGLGTDPDTGAAALATGAPLSITLTGANAALVIGDAAAPTASLTGSTITLTTPGAITEAAGALVAAGTLTGSSSTATLTPTAGNQVLNLGAFTTSGNFSLADSTDLTVTGAVVAGPNPPTATTPVLSLSSGKLDINGGSLTAGTVILSETGAITETNGFIDANTLNVTGAQFTGLSNQNLVSTLSGATTPAGFAFTDGESLTTTGPIVASAGPISLTVTGDLTTQTAVTAGQAVTFAATGQITDAAASTITGLGVTTTSGGMTTVSGTVNGTAGPVMISSNGLQVGGTVSGTAITLAAGTGAFNALLGSTITGTSLTSTSALATNLAGTVATSGFISVASTGLTVSGGVTSSGGPVTLDAGTGAFTETGSISGASVTTTSGGMTTLSGTVVGTSGGPVMVTSNGLQIGGTVTGGAITLNAGTGAFNALAASQINGTTLASTSGGTTTLAGTVSTSGVITVASNGLTISGGVTSSAGPITLNAGTGAFTETGSVSGLGVTTTSGGLTTLSGSLSGGAGPVMVTSNGLQVGGTVAGGAITLNSGSGTFNALLNSRITGTTLASTSGDAATLAGTISTSGAINVAAVGLIISGGVTSTGGAITLDAKTGTFTETGSVSGTSLTSTSGGPTSLAGSVTTTDFVTVASNGLTIGGSIGAGGAVSLNAGSGALTETGSVSGSSITTNSAGLTTLSGATSTPGGLNVTATGVLVSGAISAGPITVAAGGGALTETSAGTINGATLTTTSGGPTSLAGLVSISGDIGVQSVGLAVDGTVRSSSGAVKLDAGSGTFAETGPISGVTVTTNSGGQTSLAGKVSAAGLLSVTANGIQVSGTLSGNPIVLNAGNGGLTEASSGQIAGSAITTSSGGATTLSGAVNTPGALKIAANGIVVTGALSGNPLTLDAGSGSINETSAGAISGSTVTSTSGGSTTFAGTVNSAGALLATANGIEVDGRVTGNPVTFAAGAGPLTVAAGASVSGTSFKGTANGPSTIAGSVIVPGDASLTSNGIVISGQLVSNNGTVALDSGAGQFTLSGLVQAGTAITSTGQSVVDTGRLTAADTIAVTTIGDQTFGPTSVTQDGTSIKFNAGGTITIGGKEMSPLIILTAPSIQVQNGTFTVGGTPQSGLATPFTALPTATTATAGLFFEAGSQFNQTGTTTVVPYPGYNQTTIRVDLTSGNGTADFQTFNAPTGNLILNLGQGTTAGGPLEVNNLTVEFSGTGVAAGSADLFGQIGIQVGSIAAGSAAIIPQPNRDFRFNSCAIGSVNCIVLSPTAVPVGNPLKELSLNFFREQDDDNDLLVPNISDQGL